MIHSIGMRLVNHKIDNPIDEGSLPSQILSQATTRIHHLAVGIAHIPVAIIELIAASVLTIPSYALTLTNTLTCRYFTPLSNFSRTLNTQTVELWLSIGHSIPSIFMHAIRTINPNATREDDSLNLGLFTLLPFKIIRRLDLRDLMEWVYALTLISTIPIMPFFDLCTAPISILASMLTLGLSNKINSIAYNQIHTVARYPMVLTFIVLAILNGLDCRNIDDESFSKLITEEKEPSEFEDIPGSQSKEAVINPLKKDALFDNGLHGVNIFLADKRMSTLPTSSQESSCNTHGQSLSRDDAFNKCANLAKRGQLDELKQHIQDDASPLYTKPKILGNLLHYAAIGDHIKLIEWLLSRNPLLIKETTICGETALHTAAECNSLQSVEYFMGRFPDLIDKRTSRRETVFHVAVEGGALDVMEYLYLRKSGLMAQSNRDGWFPLHFCAIADKVAAAQWFLDKDPDLKNSKTKKNEYLPHIAAQHGAAKVLNLCYQRFPSICELSDIKGRTVLHHAVEQEDISIIKLVLSKSPNLAFKVDSNKKSPIDLARKNESIKELFMTHDLL